MLSEETLIGINKLIKLLEGTNGELQQIKFVHTIGRLSARKMEDLKALLRELLESKKLDTEVAQALQDQLQASVKIYHNLNLDIVQIKASTLVISQVLKRYFWMAACLVIVSTIITAIALTRFHKEPFNQLVAISQNPKMDLSGYPGLSFPAKLTLFPPGIGAVEALVNQRLEAAFLQIPAELHDRKMPVKLEDPYWRLATDSVVVNGERITIRMVPNDVLRFVHGHISTGDEHPVSGAEVHIGNDTLTFSDAHGDFHLRLSDRQLKEIQVIKVKALGYNESSQLYRSNSSAADFTLYPSKTNQ